MTKAEDLQRFPFLELCGIKRPHMADGRCTAYVEPAKDNLNSLGIAHGGLVTTLADAAMGGACRSAVRSPQTVVTVNMQISFFAPATGRLDAEGAVVRQTKTMIFAECDVTNASGKSVAQATGVFRILDRNRFADKDKS